MYVTLTKDDGTAFSLTSMSLSEYTRGIGKAVTFTGTPDQLRARADQLAAAGVTELAYQPAGPDIPGELERMHAALA